MTVHGCCVTFPSATHGAVWKERRSLTAGNKPIKTALEKETLAIDLVVKQLAIIPCLGMGDRLSQG